MVKAAFLPQLLRRSALLLANAITPFFDELF